MYPLTSRVVALPVLPAVIPPSIVGQTNGHISADHLTNVGGPEVRLLADEAAISFVRLRDACLLGSGVFLYIMGGGAYRSYDEQVALFRQRYQTPPKAGLPADHYRTWNGVRYSLKPGYASAAVPGTSNHGLGIAVDVAEPVIDPDTGKVMGTIGIASSPAWGWLLGHAVAYGWSWEFPQEPPSGEPWHLRLVSLPVPIPIPEDDDVPTEIKLVASDHTTFVWNPPTNTLRWVNDGNVDALEPVSAFAVVYDTFVPPGVIPNQNSVDDAIHSLIVNTVKAGVAPNGGMFQGAW